MKLTRIDYNGGYLWVADKKERPSTKDFTYWCGLLFYPLSAIYDNSLKVVAQSPNLLIPNVPYVEFEDSEIAKFCKKHGYNYEAYVKGGEDRDKEIDAHIDGFIEAYHSFVGRYSEGQLEVALFRLYKKFSLGETKGKGFGELSKEIILSLNQPPLEIEIETVCSVCGMVDGHKMSCKTDSLRKQIPVTYERDGKTYLKIKQ